MIGRRGFFAAVAVALTTPKALKLVPVAAPRWTDFNALMKSVYPEEYSIGYQVWRMPTSPMGRLECIHEFLEDGLITNADAARLIEKFDASN